MFTGLVETTAAITEVVDQSPGWRLVIDAGFISEDAALGDSICINGCCLTVVQIDQRRLHFEAGQETLSRTNLGNLTPGDRVNLERSLAVGDRLGGHYVTGHVDALGTLVEKTSEPTTATRATTATPPNTAAPATDASASSDSEQSSWITMRFTLPGDLAKQVASKGSIAIDGVSLTVVDANDDSFTVALIPHTLSETTLGDRQVGDRVNLETDVLAKYVHRALGHAGR